MKLDYEGETLEFKESLSQKSRAFESLAAMLTKSGKGKVIFGVKDNGEVIGLKDLTNDTKDKIAKNLMDRIYPKVIPYCDYETIDNKTVLVIEVNGNNKPYSFDDSYFIRSGSQNKKIPRDLLKEIFLNSDEELMIEMESSSQDLTFNQLKQLYISRNLYFNEETFKTSLNLLNKNHKYNILASLLSDNNDYSIKVVRFSSLDKSEMIERNEYGYRCLILALQSVLDYVSNINITRVDLFSDNGKRKETKLFDFYSFREAWINACLHTKWQKLIAPSVYIYPNRIEIISNGGLAYDFPITDFYKGITHTINKSLEKIFSQFDYVEQTGHGVITILSNYGKEAFDINENYILVTLKFPFNLEMNNNSNISLLSKSEKSIYEAIRINPLITVEELIKVTNFGQTTINKTIKKLKELNLIERIGSNKSGYWKIK